MLVVESWGPIVGLVFRDYGARAFALAERIEIVCSREFAAANYIVKMLEVAKKLSGLV